MSRKVYLHRFTVEHKPYIPSLFLDFPTSMLSRDSCFPATENDSVKMCNPEDFADEDTGTVQINLKSYQEKSWMPTSGRWNSFGYRVIRHEVCNCINE